MKQLYAALSLTLVFTSFIHSAPIPLFYQLKDNAYRRDIYPHDQNFVVDLLRRVDQVEPGSQITYLRAVLKAFTNITKGTHYITAHAFNAILNPITNILAPYMQTIKHSHYLKHHAEHDLDMLNRLKIINKNILLHEFETNFDMFRSAPTAFLDNLADELMNVAQKELEMQELRHTILMFLEVHLNKLIWAPEDQEDTWELVKTMSDNLALFVKHDVLDDIGYLDDAYWTLIHRYCHFLDLTHEFLEYSLFSAIRQDIIKNEILLFDLEEQDTCLEKRVDCMRATLMHVEAKKQALEHGLI